jgi:hypothetical protein
LEQPKVEAQAAVDAAGNLRIGYVGLSKEDHEVLKALLNMPHWKLYRDILVRAQAEYARAAMNGVGFDGMIDSWKNQGIAAGLNFAVTQLPILCREYDAKNNKALEKQDKPKVPFTRG